MSARRTARDGNGPIEVGWSPGPVVIRQSADGWGVGCYSADDSYRYWFRTRVDPARRGEEDLDSAHSNGLPVISRQSLVWIGLNPSSSDDNGKRRNTLETVLSWAGRDDFSDVVGVNLYAYRHTDSRQVAALWRAGRQAELIGPGNDEVLSHVAASDGRVLLAWGNEGRRGDRGTAVAALITDAWCIDRCKNGEPWHPARKPRHREMQPFR